MYVVLSYVFFNMSGTLFSKTPKMYLKENASSRSAVGRGRGMLGEVLPSVEFYVVLSEQQRQKY